VQADQPLGQLNYCFISGPQLKQYSQFIVKHEHRVVIKPNKYSISPNDQYPSGTSTDIKNRNASAGKPLLEELARAVLCQPPYSINQ
jgi:hypothetical protein